MAVSGGPDSLALAWLAHEWAQEHGRIIHFLHVDHGLRAESAHESKALEASLSDWKNAKFISLKWEGAQDEEGRVQERARQARYDLMRGYCLEHGVKTLMLAHHMDDQAETLLFRLAKGSGLDGLSGMAEVSESKGLKIIRPLLNVAKEDLIAICEAAGLQYFEDPSNEDEKYARVRLREARAVLEQEGLSNKRLAVTAKRLRRAREALDVLAQEAYKKVVLYKDTNCIEFKFDVFIREPEELRLRLILRVLETLGLEKEYAPRMEKVEALVEALSDLQDFKKRTLGGVVFGVCESGTVLRFSREGR